MISPCVSLCAMDAHGHCVGCARTQAEKIKWKDQSTTDDWKRKNLEQCRFRMSTIQKDYWDRSYSFKQTHNISIHKYGKKIKNEI